MRPPCAVVPAGAVRRHPTTAVPHGALTRDRSLVTFTTRPELVGTYGMVASTHWLASQSGMAVLEAGGNAFDAAVAAGLVLHVVEPHLNGLGGDLPVIAMRPGGEPFVVCGQGVAPAAATPARFADLGLAHVPGTGHLTAVVPGAFGAWLDLLARHGTWSFADVARYAIGYARDGFPLVPRVAETIARVADLFRAHWPSSAATWLPDGAAPAPSTRFRNPDLAATLQRLSDEAAAAPTREAGIEAARRAFYEGFVAEAVDAFCRTPLMDSTGTPHAGLLTGDDLAAWRATEEPTVSASFAGRTVHKTGPWGQGPVLLQQLQMLDALGVGDLRPGSAELVHVVTEVAKLALADRDAWYGDPAVADVPLSALLDPGYAAARAATVGTEASGDWRPGDLPGRAALVGHPGLAAAVAGVPVHGSGGAWTGEPTLGTAAPREVQRGDTCHLDVVDAAGNVVSATPSGGWLQSSPTVPGLGLQLPTRAQMFWLADGVASALRPGARPRTTLSPTLVVGDGEVLACGTPGGDQQDQWQVCVLLGHLVFGMDLQEAIDAPAWHTTHLVSSFDPRTLEARGLHVESRLGEGVLEALRARGHAVTDAGPWSLGRVSAVARRDDGLLRAAANPRGMQGYAVGR